MDPKIVDIDGMYLAGMTSYGKVSGEEWTEWNFIGRLWQRFMNYWASNSASIEFKSKGPNSMYEVSVWNEEEIKEHSFSTFFGVEVESFDMVPFQLECKTLPKCSMLSLP